MTAEYRWGSFKCLALLAEQISVSLSRKSSQVWKLPLFAGPISLCHLSPFQQRRSTTVSEPIIIQRPSLGPQKLNFPESLQQTLSRLLQKSTWETLKRQFFPDEWWEWSAGLCAACGLLGEDCHFPVSWIHHFCLTALRGCLSQLHLSLPLSLSCL